MYQLENLKNMRATASNAVNAMQTQFDKMQVQVDKIKSDNSLLPSFKTSKLDEIYKQYEPLFIEKIKVVNDIAAKVKAQAEQWEDKPLLLSRQKPKSMIVDGATITPPVMALAELLTMPTRLLQLTFEAALHENNLPMIYLTWLAASDKPDVVANIDAVAIPEQEAGLALIKEMTQAFVARAEMLYQLGSGRELSSVQRLSVAYAEA